MKMSTLFFSCTVYILLTKITRVYATAEPIRHPQIEPATLDDEALHAMVLHGSSEKDHVVVEHLNLKGKVLRIASTESPPFVVSIANDSVEGLVGDLLVELGARFNFRASFVRSADGFYGGKDANGTWNGMIRMLVNREVDLVAADLVYNAERVEGKKSKGHHTSLNI